jgi:hypothetical protein
MTTKSLNREPWFETWEILATAPLVVNSNLPIYVSWLVLACLSLPTYNRPAVRGDALEKLNPKIAWLATGQKDRT